ncbi:unnamed protein product [[Candida] boidinii]|nr:unnamed protein product [[Candida] boidinii]
MTTTVPYTINSGSRPKDSRLSSNNNSTMDRYNRYHSQQQHTQQQSLSLAELSEENDNISDTDMATTRKNQTRNTNINDNTNANNNKISSSVFGSHSKNWSNNLSKSFKKLAPSKLQKKYENNSDTTDFTYKNKTNNVSSGYDNITTELNRSPILQNLTLSDNIQRENRNKQNDNFLQSNNVLHEDIDSVDSINNNYLLNYDHHSTNNHYMNNKPRRKNYSEQSCIFCLEPLKSTLNESLSPFQFPNSNNNKSISSSLDNGERIIELDCSDQCHEHCLAMLMQLSNSGILMTMAVIQLV